ncbi:hypothetical protein L0F63_004501 [Massospora cicadina]|nr:hypothetical protein L0F63_004501 [Massospora cicadina]
MEEINASPYLNDFNSSPLPGVAQPSRPMLEARRFSTSEVPGSLRQILLAAMAEVGLGLKPSPEVSSPARCCQIGNWHRRAVVVEDMSRQEPDGLDRRRAKHQISISFPFRNISGIELAFTDPVDAELRINLNQVPDFAVFSTPGQWVPCADFTENQQATQCLRHVIKGEAQGLRVQVLGLLHLSQELSTVARILGISSASQSAAQLEARRRQSISIVNSQGLLPENLGPTAGCGLSMPFDPQYMANLALDRAKNRSLSLPTLPQQQLNLGETSVAYQPGQVTIDPSTSLNNATFPDLINLGFSNFYSALADTQSYGQFPQELPASAFQTPVLPHHFEAEPGFGQPFDSQLQNPPQSSFLCSQSSQFGLASESGARADGTSSINFTSIPSLAPQSHDLHAPLP